MDFAVNSGTCRVCLVNKPNNQCLSDSYGGTIPQIKGNPKLECYLDVYEFVAGSDMQPLTTPTAPSASQFFPKRICNDCAVQLTAAFEFRRKILRSEDVLRNLMELYDEQDVHQVEVIEEEEIDIKDVMDTIEEIIEEEQEVEYVEEGIEYDDGRYSTADEFEDASENVTNSEYFDGAGSSNQSSQVEPTDKQTIEAKSAARLARYNLTQKEDVLFRSKKSLTTQCEDCGKMVTTRFLKQHRSFHQRDDSQAKPYVCDICNAQFTLRENLSKHKRIHSNDKRYVCSYCNKKFLHWASRRYHIDRCHTGEKKHVCELCGKGFCNSSQYIIHTRRHTGATPYACDQCDRKFVNRQALTNHLLTHSDARNFPCDVCGKAYKSRKSLRVHIRTLHDQEKNYVCPICSQAFSQNHVLRTHLLKNHPDYEPPPPGTVVSVKGLERLRKQIEVGPDAD